MARVLTNNTSLRVATETSIGTLPGSPSWTITEFDNITAYGAEITTVTRRPIGTSRGRKKGTVTDLESSVEFETDLTIDAFQLFAEGFMFAEFANKEFDLRSSSGTLPPPAVAAGGVFTIDAASALLAGKMQYGAATVQTLVFAKGYSNAVNNGLHVLAADVASTDTSVDVGTTLVDETPPTNATLRVCGIRTDDLTFTISGSTATLVSAADVDWTTVGLTVGQFIHIGSPDSSGDVQNAYNNTGTDDCFGYARITAITATTLTLDKLDVNLGSAGSPYSPETIDVMFGRFCRNVEVTADSDDERYLERTYQFEATYPDLGGVGTDEYEYAVGNFVNELAFNLPLTDKATCTFSFIGTNSDDITASRKTNAATATSPLRTTAFNTSSDIISISTDVVSAVSDVCFKSLTLSILNNVSPEKCLGTLGAVFVNAGLFEANLEGQMLFTNKAIVNAIKNNTTVTFAAIISNDDGAIAVDMPELTLGGGGREFPVDQSVLVNITGQSFTSATFGHDISFSLFDAVPGVAA
jgi:hypothetical protein